MRNVKKSDTGKFGSGVRKLVKVLLFVEVFAFFILLFYWMRKERFLNSMFYLAQDSLEHAAKRRKREQRSSLLTQNRRKGFLYRLEKVLIYSGVGVRFPSFTPEIAITVGLILGSLLYFGGLFLGVTWWLCGILVALVYVGIVMVLNILMLRNYNRTDEELLKFLDFLGNYSITSGEITSVLKQISGYLKEPLKTVLEEGYVEAQTCGNTGMALLEMAEKIQHPKFKEIIYNMEVTLRYSADFTTLVGQSRRAVRENMKLRRERKSMAKEAWINILILGGMTMVILKAVEVLIGVPIVQIIFETWVGRFCLAGIAVILLLFGMQVRRIST